MRVWGGGFRIGGGAGGGVWGCWDGGFGVLGDVTSKRGGCRVLGRQGRGGGWRGAVGSWDEVLGCCVCIVGQAGCWVVGDRGCRVASRELGVQEIGLHGAGIASGRIFWMLGCEVLR